MKIAVGEEEFVFYVFLFESVLDERLGILLFPSIGIYNDCDLFVIEDFSRLEHLDVLQKCFLVLFFL
jgi:hypothetical protein